MQLWCTLCAILGEAVPYVPDLALFYGLDRHKRSVDTLNYSAVAPMATGSADALRRSWLLNLALCNVLR